MTNRILNLKEHSIKSQSNSDELNRLGDELKSAFEEHVKPIIDEIHDLSEKIDNKADDESGALQMHLAALWKYMGFVEWIYQHMRDKAIALVERLK